MKKIRLTQGRFALVDDADFVWLSQWKWYYTKDGYAARSVWKPKKRILRMHREILELKNPEIYGEHRDGNCLNNRRSNLRKSSNSQNQMNCHVKNGRYKGVYLEGKRWTASIKKNQKSMYIGSFEKMKDAARAYNNKAKEIFGEFARLNVL